MRVSATATATATAAQAAEHISINTLNYFVVCEVCTEDVDGWVWRVFAWKFIIIN